MKKTRFIAIPSVLLCIVTFIYFNRINNLNTNRTSHDTYISYGFLDSDGNILSNGSKLDLKFKEKINHTLDLDQVIEENREYLLIALVDFKQVMFKVDGKYYSCYKFNTSKSDHIEFNLEIDIPKKSKELDYILIRKPYYMPHKKNIESLLPLQTVLPIRFKINDLNDEIKYEKMLRTYTEGPSDNIWISNKENNFDLLYETNENDDIFLTLGNDGNEVIDYAVVLFNNWEQVEFNDGDMTKFLKVNPKEKQSLKFNLPDVEEDTYFQAIAFPLPYKVDPNDMMSTNAFGSCKFIIKNNAN
ncbi:MAG: hypothetical protein RSE41_07060 [Clostridia bacterium]